MENKLPFERIKRKIIVRKQAETDENLGSCPDKRPTEEIINYGIVNIDKPKGPTSHQCSDYVQKILNIEKSGHSGTLDPRVTGALPIALGRATRIVEYLLKAGKEYVAIMHLHKEVQKRDIKKVFKEFTGKIKQIPPLKSSVRREEREREVYYIDILEIDEKDVLFKIGSEAGTYIRKFCHDIGKKLGCGAHMSELRRTKVASFNESTLVTLQDLSDAYIFWKENKNDKLLRKYIQPIENAVMHLPKIWVFDTTIASLCHGARLNIPGISKLNDKIKKDDTVAMLSLKDELIGLGKAQLTSEEIIKEDKGLAVKTEKVFMLPDDYLK